MRPAKLNLLLGLLLIPFSAGAIVDMKSANYSESWTDLIVPGIGYDLRINRTYNSRSLFNGLFGFGWCSDYETTIDVTTEGNLRLTECGAGQEVNYTPRSFKAEKIDDTVNTIMAEVRKRRPDLGADYLKNLERDMKTNDLLREEFGRHVNIKGKAQDGVVYLANGRETETIVHKNGTYKRTMADGTYQVFDSVSGRMTHMYDKNQNYLKLTWNKDILISVADNQGRKLTFKINPASKKVSEIVGPNGLAARYVVKGEDLAEVTDAKQNKFKYGYDEVHNLLRIDYADGSHKALTYNKDMDWVTTFKNRKGCIESYDYNMSKDDPKNHFWSNVTKKCGDKVTNQSKYEFFHKPRPDGIGVFLYRVKTENNGAITDVVYHEVFGKPVSMVRDGKKTEYSYYDNGLVRTKKESGRTMAFEYKNACSKVSLVTLQTYDDAEAPSKTPRKPAKNDKAIRTMKTKFIYEAPKCNLAFADNSDGQTVKLLYDQQGRIAQIEDQSKKLVTIKYEARFGKPSIVTRPGLGTIHVTYKGDGEIQKVESKEGPKVAVQVASIFNNLLDIIAPATTDAPL